MITLRSLALARGSSRTMRYTLLAVALLVSACHGIQPTPVAPLPTSPTPTSEPAPTPHPVASFSVSVNANGEVAYVNEVWNTTLVVTSSDPSAGLPASVVFDCGSGTGERVLSGFIGQISVACTFANAGQYTVRASVVFQNAVTTATMPLTAVMRPATSSARTADWQSSSPAH